MIDKIVAWMGDGNNEVLHSLIEAVVLFYFHLRMVILKGSEQDNLYNWARERGAHRRLIDNPQKVARDADCIMADPSGFHGIRISYSQSFYFQLYQDKEALMK